MREGVFIFERGTNPYDGGVFHHVRLATGENQLSRFPAQTLLLSLPYTSYSSLTPCPFRLISSPRCHGRWRTCLVLLHWCASGERGSFRLASPLKTRKGTRLCPLCEGALIGRAIWTNANIDSRYLFNPYTLMSCLARTTTSLDNSVLLLAIHSANSGK